MTNRYPLVVLVLLMNCASVLAADSGAGRSLFRERCTVCHSAEPNDNGGAQGPSLRNVFGRRAASADPAFSYTQALRNANLTWDAAALEHFLASPAAVVPGTAMAIDVPKRADRDDLIEYLRAVQSGAVGEGRSSTPDRRGDTQEDWQQDAPGRVHRIDVARLPQPFHTSSARNVPQVVSRPADARLRVPAGFKAEVFASDLQGPRTLRLAPNGDIFVVESRSGRVKVLRPSANGATARMLGVFADGLKMPFGIEFYPGGKAPKWLYVAQTNRVVRYAYKVGDTKASAAPETVVAELAPFGEGGHVTRDLAFSPDGRRMFVSVGSASNVAETLPKKTPAEVAAWDAEHGVGAAWDKETNRAAVLVFDVGTNEPGRIFATGLRNCVGLTIQPATGDLWCTTNERDLLGDDLVPDYSTRVKEGGFYGWPWYYMGQYEDPRLKGDRPDLAGKAIVPDVPYQAHSASLTLTFYTATSGRSAFPREYVGDGFAMFHGSWNRAFRTGHKVVRVRMQDGVPTGEYEDFMVGLVGGDGNPWGRPVAALVARDGSLLVSDDGANVIYRISYSGERP